MTVAFISSVCSTKHNVKLSSKTSHKRYVGFTDKSPGATKDKKQANMVIQMILIKLYLLDGRREMQICLEGTVRVYNFVVRGRGPMGRALKICVKSLLLFIRNALRRVCFKMGKLTRCITKDIKYNIHNYDAEQRLEKYVVTKRWNEHYLSVRVRHSMLCWRKYSKAGHFQRGEHICT